ncbi:nucleotidyltransferase domain-containing protein [Thermococcus sp. SY098]|uniref:nucleotidyltransferase domain-containing protein n=1 Tax=Thermococcus sp. SY098 TaxID=3111325 RepID=UPI002D792C09|nr:nucleotidyltransferase domain-containing protein [Thermococcus sp. SY098]WRS52867.1 nucleotidyltransferase domain-containing protein [Thermococcus sp. SY098]
MNEKIINELKNFAKDLKELLGEKLVAVIVFGSVLASERFEDIDILIVVDNTSKDELKEIRRLKLKYRYKLGKYIDLNICEFSDLNKGVVYTAVALGKELYSTEKWINKKKEIKKRAKERKLQFIEKYGKKVVRWELAELIN